MSFGVPALRRVFDDSPGETRARILSLVVLLVGANLGAWAIALVAFAGRPVLLGTALLAYGFGLRHAVDADHISAIDNVTRALMQARKRPVAVGFFFSLGHSTIVIALSLAIAVAAGTIRTTLPGFQTVGGIVGSLVSAFFLFLIAAINLSVLAQVWRTLGAVRCGKPYAESELDGYFDQRGLLGRCFRPLLRCVQSSWQMYPVGMLFGLGFDTATEIGLLGIAALEAGKGLPVGAILVFPLLFTVGMCLLDTADGVLMLGAYGWAFVTPLRKLRYNVAITSISVAVAIVVGTIELLGVVGAQLSLHGPLWDAVGAVGDHFGTIGFAIIALVVAVWGVALVHARRRKRRMPLAEGVRPLP